MRGHLLIFGLVLSGFSALAGSTGDLEEALREGGFYKLDELPAKPGALELARNSVVRMAECSAVILSNTGLVATNIHCIRECLTDTWDNKPDIQQRFYEKQVKEDGHTRSLYKITRYDESIPTRLKCMRHVLSSFTIFKYQLQSPEFVWMGRGRNTHDERHVTEFPDDIWKELKDATEDVVLLRYKLHESFPSVPCMPLSKREPVRGQLLWTLGYPAWNKRKNGRGASGEFLVASLGRYRASVSEDPIYAQYASEMDETQRSEFWRREKRIWDGDHLVRTSSDAYGGNSGGLIMNSDGAVGITFTITKSSSEDYTGGTTIGVSTSHLRARLAAEVGAEVVREIDSCKN